MLTPDERCKLRQALQLTVAAESLLDDCIVRKGDRDSAELYEVAKQIADSTAAIQALVSRFATIPLVATKLPFAGIVR